MRRNQPQFKFFLDANCINARQQNPTLNELENFRAEGFVTLVFTEATHREAGIGKQERTDKAAGFSYTKFEPFCDGNEHTKLAIEFILFPAGAKTDNHRNDVLAVYHAERLRWPLVTMDGASKKQPGGILGRAAELATLGIEVISPECALARVRAACSGAAQLKR